MKGVLESLRAVRGAVSTKDHVPEMRHFVIENGAVRSFNGVLAICSPIDLDIQCAPRADPMVKSIMNCQENTFLSLLKNGKLRVKSGPFRSDVDCVELEGLPHQTPQGERYPIDGEILLEGFRRCSKFIGNDASRPWSNGILFRGSSMFATNNVTLVEFWTGTSMPREITIPAAAIREVERIDEPPTSMSICDHSATFHYENGRWIRTQLLSTQWPDFESILNQPSDQKKVPEGFYAALGALKPFLGPEGRVYFNSGEEVATDPDGVSGASYTVPGIYEDGVYHLKMLELLKDTADTIDFSRYPDHLLFYGDRLRGALIGQRR